MPPIYFLQPLFLWGLTLPLVPLAIHLWHRQKLPRVPFAALRFLRAGQEAQQRKQRLRELLLLIARMALLALVALAMAMPTLTPPEVNAASSNEPRAVAIVLDTSASMRLTVNGEELIETARRDATNLVRQLRPGDLATVVIAGRETRVPLPEPTPNHNAAISAITAATAEFGVNALGDAVNAAVAEVQRAAVPHREVVVYSDFRENAVASLSRARVETGASVEVTLNPVVAAGDAPANAAVAEALAAAVPGEGNGVFRVLAGVQSSGDLAELAPMVSLISSAGETRASVQPAGPRSGTAELRAVFREPGLAALDLTLSDDALAADNHYPLLVNVPPVVNVLLVNGSPRTVRHRDELFYAEAALLSGAATADALRARVALADSLTLASLAGIDVLVLANVGTVSEPVAAEIRAFVERGGGLLVTLGDEVKPERYDQLFADLMPAELRGIQSSDNGSAPVRFTEPATDSTIFGVFAGEAAEGFLSTSVETRFVMAPATDNDRVLLPFSDGSPAFIEGKRGLGNVIVYASSLDRDWGDFAVRTSFLPALQRLLVHLGNALERVESRIVKVDEIPALRITETPLPERLALLLRADSGEEVDLRIDNTGTVEIPPRVVATPGIKRIFRRGTTASGTLDPALTFGVRIDPLETTSPILPITDVRTALEADKGTAMLVRIRENAGEADSPWHSYLLALAAALVFCESLLAAPRLFTRTRSASAVLGR